MNMVNMNMDSNNQSSESFVNNSSFLHNKLNSLNEQMNKDNVFVANKMILNNNNNNNPNYTSNYSNHAHNNTLVQEKQHNSE